MSLNSQEETRLWFSWISPLEFQGALVHCRRTVWNFYPLDSSCCWMSVTYFPWSQSAFKLLYPKTRELLELLLQAFQFKTLWYFASLNHDWLANFPSFVALEKMEIVYWQLIWYFPSSNFCHFHCKSFSRRCLEEADSLLRHSLNRSIQVSTVVQDTSKDPKGISFGIYHWVKSVCTRSFSGPHFPAFGLNTGKYEQEKLRIRTLFM